MLRIEENLPLLTEKGDLIVTKNLLGKQSDSVCCKGTPKVPLSIRKCFADQPHV